MTRTREAPSNEGDTRAMYIAIVTWLAQADDSRGGNLCFAIAVLMILAFLGKILGRL